MEATYIDRSIDLLFRNLKSELHWYEARRVRGYHRDDPILTRMRERMSETIADINEKQQVQL